MNFNSLKEYFYKLYNACLLRLLLSMGLFLLVYYFFLSGSIPPYIREEKLVDFLRFTFLALTLITLTIVHLVSIRSLKIYADTVGLGDKLVLYHEIVKLRMRTLLLTSFFLAAGFFFTGHPWFSLYFGGMMSWYVIHWPTPGTVSRELKLKGDERTMVMTKGEAFRF